MKEKKLKGTEEKSKEMISTILKPIFARRFIQIKRFLTVFFKIHLTVL